MLEVYRVLVKRNDGQKIDCEANKSGSKTLVEKIDIDMYF